MSSEPTSTADLPYTVQSLADRPDLSGAHQTLGGSVWPEFMLHDPVAIAHWENMMRFFAGDQLSILVEGEIAAVVNMVPDKGEIPTFKRCPTEASIGA